MKTFSNYFWTFLTIVFLVAIPANPEAAEKTLSNNKTNTYKLLNLFGDAFERIRKSYVSEVSDERLIEAAINGMLTSLDPHSAFLNAKNFKDALIDLRFCYNENKEDINLNKMISQICIYLGRYEESIDFANNVLTKDIHNAEAYFL